MSEIFIEQLKNLMPEATILSDVIDGVSLFRIEHSFSRTPYSYNAGIIMLAQGEKQVYLEDQMYTYNSSRYLVLPVPLPAACEGITKEGQPLLGLTITIDLMEIGEILLGAGGIPAPGESLPRGIYSAAMNETIMEATIRLLKAISHPTDRSVLGPMIKKEIIYRVLQGENGEILQALAHRNRRFFQIARILQKIHESYKTSFSMEDLAKESDMGNSTFHSSFKAVTGTSPLQYIKNVRLHKARSLMIYDGLNAAGAALEVGYESPSQFSREYKRLFGTPPAKDASLRTLSA
ncbi:AraC family transcriptional regulator [Myxococcota bacterium]|nr:AraC family transcriptional regulator [Myxococcota bacterium]MBU1379376.1 AraC family transcriptional regulator [Myxococcota bacterium]MBU1499235.1 AraC family transcriptional regulator [Myxococcota bacterium]